MGTAFLRDNNVTETIIDKVSQCIMATRFNVEPTNELEKIIRDADASHFAKDYFQEASEFLRLEWKKQDLKNISKRKWLEGNIDLLQNKHRFYTKYAQEYWIPKKQENIQTMNTEKDKLTQEKN